MTTAAQVAISNDGHLLAFRPHSSDSWWVFQVPPQSHHGYLSDLPPSEWTRLFPATERDLAAEELARIGDELESAESSLASLRARLGGEQS